ncbi:hypothetical protein SVIOM342S_00128 [Streptomyces violaceorubidus]
MPSMRVRTSSVLAASLVLALSAGPLAAPAFAGPPAAATAEHQPDGPDAKALRAALAMVPDEDATAALVRVGGTDGTWRGSAGVRDLASGRPAHPDARFRAGSVTKVVTAATVLRLAAQDRVDLDAPVQRYLPDLFTADFDEPISVRQLLNHTSGIQAGDGLGRRLRPVCRAPLRHPHPAGGRGVGDREGAGVSSRASGSTTSTSTTRSSAC